MRKTISAIALLAPLGGCVVTPMACQQTVMGSVTAFVPCVPATAYNVIPPHRPGYAPAYPPYEAYRPPRRHEWVTDTPHWQPGDE